MSEQSPNLEEQQPLNTGAATAPPHDWYLNLFFIGTEFQFDKRTTRK